MKKLFCICYLFLVLCGTFPWITSCSGDDVEEVVSVQDVPSDISLFVSAWFPGAMIEQISRINEGERGCKNIRTTNYHTLPSFRNISILSRLLVT